MLRGFTDSQGVEWRVWEVFPSKASLLNPERLAHTTITEAFTNGWLCFESSVEKRRLAPIPEGWQLRERRSLEELRDLAVPVPARRRSGEELQR